MFGPYSPFYHPHPYHCILYLFCPANCGNQFPVINVGEDRHSFERTENISSFEKTENTTSFKKGWKVSYFERAENIRLGEGWTFWWITWQAVQRLLKTQELQVHKPPKPLVPDSLQGSPTYDDHHDVIRGGRYDGDLSCWHHRTGTMAFHWVAPVFLSTTPHLHCNDDSKWRAAYQIMMNHKWQTEMMMMLADMYPVKSHTFFEHSLSQAFLISVNISYTHRYCYD